MRLVILLVGLVICSLGFLALSILPKPAAFAFFQGALTLGGGILICFGFSFRMQWHGVAGSGILGLLGFAKGLGNLPHLLPPHTPSMQSWMECAVTLLSASLLASSLTALARERRRRILENP